MNRSALVVGCFAIIAVATTCLAQTSESLGNVVREQKQARKDIAKPASTKTYTNSEVAALASAESAKASSTVDAAKAAPASAQKQTTTPKSVMDRPQDSTPDAITVPAGTEIKIDVPEHKVVAPVRVGFSTPIPALSQVSVDIHRTYVSAGYAVAGMPYVDYVDYATITSITINGTSYDVETDTIPLFKGEGAANREVTFHLNSTLSIPR